MNRGVRTAAWNTRKVVDPLRSPRWYAHCSQVKTNQSRARPRLR